MQTPRLLGIELIRSLSSFAVILVHAGDESWQVPISANAISFRLFFYFGVPFFLAISFYFLTAKAELVYTHKFWKTKFSRLLVPYALWSIIFWIFRVVVFTLTDKTERLTPLTSDPVSLLLLGGASYQLYFLPMLFIGTILGLLLPLLAKLKVNNFGMIFFATLATIAYGVLKSSGNGFKLSEYSIAFESLAADLNIDFERNLILRVVAIFIAWALRCLPYLLIAAMFHKLRIFERAAKLQPVNAILLGVACIAANTVGKTFLPAGYSELLLAFLLLLLSIAISKYFTNQRINEPIAIIGSHSFGIYLIHPFVMAAMKIAIEKVIPNIFDSVTIYSMSILAISSFVVSLKIVAGMSRNKSIGKYLLGV